MNFISHYYFDRGQAESLFFVGVSTPDLVANFNRGIRLKRARLPLIMENEASEAQINFYNGILRHFEVDRLFHSSTFFKEETHLIAAILKEHFGAPQIEKSFFVAHILLELILDRLLINQHNDILYSFYSHFKQKEVLTLVRFTEWACKRTLPGYDQFLTRFAERKFLYNYSDWQFLIEVMENLLRKVGIQGGAYLRTPAFLDLMLRYEEGLSARYSVALEEITQKLCEV